MFYKGISYKVKYFVESSTKENNCFGKGKHFAIGTKGFHRKEIARRWGVSVGSVETLISSVLV
jgi:hypothetical protein